MNEQNVIEQGGAMVSAAPSARPSASFGFSRLDEMLGTPTPTKWLIRDYLEAECLAVLIGEPGSYKTFMVIDMGLSIATGTPWLANAVPNPGPVFYIAGEGQNGLAKRLKAWTVEHGVDPSGIPFFSSKAPAQFLNKESAWAVTEAVEALVIEHGPPRLVIVDTLNRNFGPGDEKDGRDMSAFVAALDRLKAKFGCSILVAHHTGLQDMTRGRGSSVLRGAVDFEYLLNSKGDVRVLTCSKCKEHEEPEPLAFRPESVKTGWSDPETGYDITSCVLRLALPPDEAKGTEPKGAARIVLEALRDACDHGNGPVSESVWRESAYQKKGLTRGTGQGAKQQAFLRARKDLLTLGLVSEKGDHWSIVK